jgi:hypothetical protein
MIRDDEIDEVAMRCGRMLNAFLELVPEEARQATRARTLDALLSGADLEIFRLIAECARRPDPNATKQSKVRARQPIVRYLGRRFRAEHPQWSDNQMHKRIAKVYEEMAAS